VTEKDSLLLITVCGLMDALLLPFMVVSILSKFSVNSVGGTFSVQSLVTEKAVEEGDLMSS
jgi:hypothetical protein